MNKKPNVLFILSDQHNPKIMGCSGDDIIQTPALDKLASTGARFTASYCQNPLCVPSRASLITGQYSRTLGIYDNRHILQSFSITMPRAFSNAGYLTCCIGKTHFNGEQFQGYNQRPYGDFYGQGHQPDPSREVNGGESGLGDVLEASGPTGIPLAMTQTEIVTSEAVKYMQVHVSQSPTQPFFLSVHYDKPHFPMCPPKRFFDMYDGKMSVPKIPNNFLENCVPFIKNSIQANGAYSHYGKDIEIHKKALAAYYGCISWVDDAVGRVVDALDYLGLGDDTIVVYSSDHGEMMAKYGAWQKSLFYDDSCSVPLIMRYPKSIKPNIYNEPVGLIDMFPTLCSMADIDIPKTCEGEDITPLFKGEKLHRDSMFAETVAYGLPEQAGCMLRTKKWKFNYYLDGEYELYDMENDSDESINLAENEETKEICQLFKDRVIEFWKPEEQLKRFYDTPMMTTHKHHYPYSNQFMVGDGRIVDARP